MTTEAARRWVAAFGLAVAISVVAVLGQGIAAVGSVEPEAGGLTVVLSPAGKHKPGQLDLALSVVRSRIDRLGVADASISRRGTNYVVHLPGVTDTSVARRLVAIAELRFRPVLISGVPPLAVSASASGDADAEAVIASCDANAAAALSAIPTNSWADDRSDACVVLPDAPGGKKAARYYLGPAGVTGRAVVSARAEFVASQGWTVKMDFTDSGSSKWDQLAEQQFHKQVAITLDGIVQSAPQIQPGEASFSSFDGTAVVSGNFREAAAKDLAKLINYGAVPSILKVKKVTVT